MTANDSSIIAICEGYRRAVYEKDVAAFLSLYHPSARVFDTWAVWSYEGTSQRQDVIEKWFSSLGTERVQVAFDRVASFAVAELACFSARVTYVALSRGAELRRMENRITWVLKPENAELKILHEHTSVPIGFPDLKGILSS